MIKGILFDKDGTLLEAGPLWARATRRVARALAGPRSAPDVLRALERAAGAEGDRIMPGSPLAAGTLEQAARAMAAAPGMTRTGPLAIFCRRVETLYADALAAPDAQILPTGDLKTLFESLRAQGMAVGLATNDTRRNAAFCLKKLGVEGYFGYLGAADTGCRPKPAPDLLWAFCRLYGLRPAEVCMVGDAPGDAAFAHAAGALAVGVGFGTTPVQVLNACADLVVDSLDPLGRPEFWRTAAKRCWGQASA